MAYLDTTCLWHPNYDRLAGLVCCVSSVRVCVCVCVCVCACSCNLTAGKKRTIARRNRTKGWKWKIRDKWRRGDSARRHSVRSHLLSKMNECTTHVYTHTLTEMIWLHEHTACSLHLQEFIHSVTKLEIKKKAQRVMKRHNARSYCGVWSQPQSSVKPAKVKFEMSAESPSIRKNIIVRNKKNWEDQTSEQVTR